MLIIIFFLGACLSSFALCFYERRNIKISILSPGSFCDSCKKSLRPLDLIPVISYLGLRARCRYCGEKISLDKLIFEILGGLILCLLVFFYPKARAGLLFLALILGLFVVKSDIESLEVYEEDLYLIIILGVIYRFLYIGYGFRFFKICLIFSLVFLLISFITNKGIGDGDLYFYMGLFLYLETSYILAFIFISIWIGGLFAIIKAIKIKSLRGKIALCPAIYFSFIFTMILGCMS